MTVPAANNPVAARWYFELEPMMERQEWPEENRIALLRWLEAWSSSLAEVDLVVRDDQDEDLEGWGRVMNPDLAPDNWLDWLAQFAGTRPPLGESAVAKRQRIKSMEGLRRGSRQAIESAVRLSLQPVSSEELQVYFFERYGSPWRLGISTMLSQTPDPSATLRAALSQKPAGLVLIYNTVTGGDFNSLTATHSDFNDITSTYIDFNEVATNPIK